MALQPSAIFLVDLVQDVAIVRPLVFMAARDFQFDTLLLVANKFAARDTTGIWRNELEEIRSQSSARIEFFADDYEAHRHLIGHGLLFAASESDLREHRTTHEIFRHAPASFVKVTLQHGFECVGLNHSAEHDLAHRRGASFAADIVCSWAPIEKLRSVAASQRSKVVVTGPTAALQKPDGDAPASIGSGLVCENLHSVRFKGERHLKSEFVGTFLRFCKLLADENRKVVLRTHPGGQYLARKDFGLPPNVQTQDGPLYRLDLRQFPYGIAPPSSVLIDMLLAKIPTAVWRDEKGHMDASNYEGLTSVSSAEEWLEFARQAETERAFFLKQQKRFLERTAMPLGPREIFMRYAELFRAARRMEVRPPAAVAERERILFIANANVPTLQLSFEKPLASLVARGELRTELLTEEQLRSAMSRPGGLGQWLEGYLDRFAPSTVIFCRYSGPGYKPVLEWARREKVPVIYHIDDDLLAVPSEIGERKYAVHNAPERLEAVAELLQAADLVYTSTEKLKRRLLGYFPDLRVVAGEIYCSGAPLREPQRRATCKVGYMASADHAHNLQLVLPAIERLLEQNAHVSFELFGSINAPEELNRFGDRISSSPPIGNYELFMEEFAKAEWDIGICPLAPIDFNMMKANTKWVEYSSAGAAVVASRGTVYDECCADGCGILAGTVQEWFCALDLLVNNVEERVATGRRAQTRLEQEFSLERLRQQVLQIIEMGRAAIAAPSHRVHREEEISICQLP